MEVAFLLQLAEDVNDPRSGGEGEVATKRVECRSLWLRCVFFVLFRYPACSLPPLPLLITETPPDIDRRTQNPPPPPGVCAHTAKLKNDKNNKWEKGNVSAICPLCLCR